MEITRNVILDILPLYMAGEVSEDTRKLVQKYLESDQELAAFAQYPDTMKLPRDIPIPLTEEDKMKAYRKTRLFLVITILILSILVALILIATFYAFLVPS